MRWIPRYKTVHVGICAKEESNGIERREDLAGRQANQRSLITKLKSGGTISSARPGANNETSSVRCPTCGSHRVLHITRRVIVRQSRGFLSRHLSTLPCPSCLSHIPRPLYPPLIPPASPTYRTQQAIPLMADGTLSIVSKGTRVQEVVRMRWESLP